MTGAGLGARRPQPRNVTNGRRSYCKLTDRLRLEFEFLSGELHPRDRPASGKCHNRKRKPAPTGGRHNRRCCPQATTDEGILPIYIQRASPEHSLISMARVVEAAWDERQSRLQVLPRIPQVNKAAPPRSQEVAFFAAFRRRLHFHYIAPLGVFEATSGAY